LEKHSAEEENWCYQADPTNLDNQHNYSYNYHDWSAKNESAHHDKVIERHDIDVYMSHNTTSL
jgi:hypothetical protein